MHEDQPEAQTEIKLGRKQASFYYAVVEISTDSENHGAPAIQILQASDKRTLLADLNKAHIVSVIGIFKGKHLQFTRQSVIRF